MLVGTKICSVLFPASLLLSLLTVPMNVCNAQALPSQVQYPEGPASESHTSPVSAKPERWDEIALDPGTLHPAPPLLGEKDSLPSFTRELIQVQWRAHDPIDLYVIRPARAITPPVILYLYGFPSDTDRFRNDAYCESVVKNGFAAVGFVSAMTGQRYHDRPMKEWFVSELPEALATSVHDVPMILDYLTERHDFDMNRVGIYGQGSGGTIAILAATAEPRLKFVDVLDPWGDWPDWMAGSPLIPEKERPGFLTSSFLERAALFDPIQHLPSLSPDRLRLQQTLFSQVTPEKARNAIRVAAPAHMLIVQYKDEAEYREKVMAGGIVLDWLKARLSSPSALMDEPSPSATKR